MNNELTMVNQLLVLLGNPPVGDLENPHPNVSVVKQFMEDAKKTVQKKEQWWFNTEHTFEVTPDENKELQLPLNTISATVTSVGGVVKRGNKLYDTVNNTYQFDAPVYCILMINLDWELLDDTPIQVIRYLAGAQICSDVLEDGQKEATQTGLYKDALADLKKEDLRVKRLNAQNSPQASKMRSRIRPYRTGRGRNTLFPGG